MVPGIQHVLDHAGVEEVEKGIDDTRISVSDLVNGDSERYGVG